VPAGEEGLNQADVQAALRATSIAHQSGAFYDEVAPRPCGLIFGLSLITRRMGAYLMGAPSVLVLLNHDGDRGLLAGADLAPSR